MEFLLFGETDIKDEYRKYLPNENSLCQRDHHSYSLILPNEIWSIILSHMDIEGYSSLPLVSSFFYFMIRERIVGLNGNYRIVSIKCKEPPFYMGVQFSYSSFGLALSRESLTYVLGRYFILLSEERIFIIRTYRDLMLYKNMTENGSTDCFFESSRILKSEFQRDSNNNIETTSLIDTISTDSLIYKVTVKNKFKEECIMWNQYPEILNEIERRISSIVHVDIIVNEEFLHIKRKT